MDSPPFGRPERWRGDDLIAVSKEFTPELTLAAYRSGVFPMPTGRAIGWYSPMARATLSLDALRVTRSMRQAVKRYDVRIDTAFDEVIARCADPRRPHGWIDRRVRSVYRRLYDDGIVHSVEAWTSSGELAGGLYGVSIGGLFAGESMFHRPDIGRDASKVALVALVDVLAQGGVDRLLDVQWLTPHLQSLGASEMSRSAYLRRLSIALALPEPSWPKVWPRQTVGP
jgi:leucyl/phenylalanyl-tRNA--protein transferase